MFLCRKRADLADHPRQMPVGAAKFEHHLVSVNGIVGLGHGGARSIGAQCDPVKGKRGSERAIFMLVRRMGRPLWR